MIGFKTKNSTYLLNESRKTVRGGVFGKQDHRYTHLKCIIGLPAEIILETGEKIVTSKVEEYLTVFNI